MASAYWIVKATLRTGNKEITSPRFGTDEQAHAALETIRAAQKVGDWVELDWLSVNGGEIVVANIERRSSGVAVA